MSSAAHGAKMTLSSNEHTEFGEVGNQPEGYPLAKGEAGGRGSREDVE